MAQRIATLQFGIDDGLGNPKGKPIKCFQYDNTDVEEGALEIFPKREFQVGKADVQEYAFCAIQHAQILTLSGCSAFMIPSYPTSTSAFAVYNLMQT